MIIETPMLSAESRAAVEVPNINHRDSIGLVETQIKHQLERTGSFSTEAADLNARLHGAFADAVSSRLGIDPHEVYERYPISVVSTDSSAPTATGGIFAQFAGPNAETADLHSLAAAKDRLTKGHEPNIVRRDTGWFKGVDNKWRYEISDHLAELLIEGVQDGATASLASILKHDRLFEAYPDLKTIPVTGVKDNDYNGMYDPIDDRFEIDCTRTPEQQLSTILHEIQHAIQAREGFAMGGSVDRRFTDNVKEALGRLRADKSISAAEWKLENQQLIKDADRARELASSALMYNSYKRLVDYAHHDRPSSVFRHIRNQLEWLHCDRARENPEFSRQSSDIYRETYRIPKPHKKHERNAFLRELSLNTAHFLRKMIGEADFETFENDQRQVSSLVKALLNNSSKARETLLPLNQLQSEKKRAETLVESSKFKTPYEIYRALAGEVEARNVQARQQLTDDERKQSSPKYTQDIDTSEIIVIHNDRQVDVPSAFYQSASGSPQHANRGSIDVTGFPAMPAQIALFAHADKSTFLHESSHYFFETLTQIARSANAPEQIKNDVATVAKWGGEKDLDSYLSADFDRRREVHEKFARGFEAYIMEGKAPNDQTLNIFEFFKSWLKDIYRSLTSLKVNLTDEVRSVMDRVITPDQNAPAPMAEHDRLKAFQERQLADMEKRSTAAIASHLQLHSANSSKAPIEESVIRIASTHRDQMLSLGIPTTEIQNSISRIIRSAAEDKMTMSKLNEIEQHIINAARKSDIRIEPRA